MKALKITNFTARDSIIMRQVVNELFIGHYIKALANLYSYFFLRLENNTPTHEVRNLSIVGEIEAKRYMKLHISIYKLLI